MGWPRMVHSRPGLRVSKRVQMSARNLHSRLARQQTDGLERTGRTHELLELSSEVTLGGRIVDAARLLSDRQHIADPRM